MASHWIQLTKYLESDFFNKFLGKLKTEKKFKNHRIRERVKNGFKQFAIFVHDSEYK